MIEITYKIQRQIDKFSKEEKEEILKKAWDACCDGQFLSDALETVEILGIDDARDIDPWDGRHEELRKQIERHAIQCAIESL